MRFLLVSTFNFCLHVRRNKVPDERIKTEPLDMQQYYKIFGTCRIPRPQRDQLTFNRESKHIIIIHNNHVSIDHYLERRLLSSVHCQMQYEAFYTAKIMLNEVIFRVSVAKKYLYK